MYGDGGLVEHARDVLYRAADSPVAQVFRGQRGATRTAALSEDGRVLVTAGAEDVQLWDRGTGEPLEVLELEEDEVVNAVDVNEDASTLVAGMADGTVLVWQVGSGRPVRWQEDTGFVWTVDLSPDGQRLVSVGADNRVQLWGLDGTSLLTATDPAATTLNYATFSPDGSQLATVSDAPEVVLWDAGSGAVDGRLPLPDGEGAWLVTFGTDASTLATITPSAVTVWDVPSWTPRYPPFTTGAGLPRNLDPDLVRVLTVESGYLDVYDLASGLSVARTEVPGAATWGAAFDLDPQRVLVVGDDIAPAFWRLRATDSYASATSAAVATDRVVSTWDDGTLRTSPTAGEDADDLVPGVDTTGVYAIAVDAAGRRVAGVTEEGQVRVWDMTTGTALAALDPDLTTTDVAYFWAADLGPDGNELVTGDSAGVVTRWDATTGEPLGEVLRVPDRGIAQLQVSPDGSTVLVALQAASVTATDSEAESEPVALVTPLAGEGAPVELRLPENAVLGRPVGGAATNDTVTAAGFAPDGVHVTVGTAAGRVAAFDARDGEPLWPAAAIAHRGRVREVLTAADGRILTTGDDRQVVVLDAAEGRRIRQVPSESDLMAAVPTPDGEHLAMLTADRGVVTVPLQDDELLDVVRSTVIHDLTEDECAYYRLPAGC
jgi:WD40 repeat protein